MSLFVSLNLSGLSTDSGCKEQGRGNRAAHNEAGHPGGWMWAELLPLSNEDSAWARVAGRASMHGHTEQSVV